MEKLLKSKKIIKMKKRNINKLLILFVLFGVMFYSCKKENTKIGVLKTYFPKDKEILFSAYFIKKGDTILDGKYILCKYNGVKIKSGIFKNGEAIGPVIFYFENGNIESIDYKNEKRLSEETTYYYESGKIKRYALSDDSEKTAFIAKFDTIGDINSWQGFPVMEVYQYKKSSKQKNDQHLKVGDVFIHKYIVANIPNTKRTFKIENLSSDNSKINRKMLKTSRTNIDVKEVLTQKGINTIRAIVKYEFNDKEKTIINDTISFSVNVN